MKIRIRGNSVRFRLTKNEVEQLCTDKIVEEKTSFTSLDLTYAIKVSSEEGLKIDFVDQRIILEVSEELIFNWSENDLIGFSESIAGSNGNNIDILLEKDFTCLDDRGEDESNNYPNPKANTNGK